jgi:glycosyltransferase involved in cell wall biosynthesis
VEVNAPLVDEQEQHRGLRLKNEALAAETSCFQSADHIVTVSKPLKSYVASHGISPHRITCLPNGVDIYRFSPSIDGSEVRARHALGDRRVVGFVGSLKPWHGLEFLFDVASLIGSRRDDFSLLLVGDGPGFAYAKERAEDIDLRGRVILAGSVRHDEIPAHLAAMDLTVAPYKAEGGTVAPYKAEGGFYFSPLKVMESLASGRPVVAPRLGQLTELVEDGVNGFLYEPEDIGACADRIDLLLSDSARRETMSRNARRLATNQLSWDRVVERVVEIMHEMRQAA